MVMQEENLMKMSEMATPPVMETYSASVLICYLLHRIGHPIEKTHLYDIAVGSDTINYFFYQESITHLVQNGSISLIRTEAGKEAYALEEKGEQCAVQLKECVSKAYRDKVVSCAMRYFARIKREDEVKIEYLPLEHGYYVHVRCLDVQADLLDMKLYAPDLTQAKYLGSQIMLNPAGFYGKILDAAFSNKEKEETGNYDF
jgi:predicted transcriptional regulator